MEVSIQKERGGPVRVWLKIKGLKQPVHRIKEGRMKLTIESTPTVLTLGGVRVRVWKGTTPGGNPCEVFVRTIHNCGDPKTAAELAAELVETTRKAASDPGPLDPRPAALAKELEACPPLKLDVDAAAALCLIAAVQLASRHPTGRFSPGVQLACRLARRMQEALASHSAETGRLIEQGWHAAYDVPAGPSPEEG
jgi:hypothetical protein